MRILGLDPGTATTGYGIIDVGEDGRFMAVSYGTITTPAKTPMPSRLQTIERELIALIEEFQPDIALARDSLEKSLFTACFSQKCLY